MTAGAVVQIVSVICPSRMNCLICLFWMIHIQWVPVARSPGVKHPGCEANHSPPISVKVKNEWSYTSVHAICLHGVDGDILYTRTNICVCVCVFPVEKQNRNKISVTALCAIQTSRVCGFPFILFKF